VHTGGLYALDHTGPELVVALGLLSLVLAVSGSGRLGLDHLIVRRVVRGRASSDRSTFTDGSNEFRSATRSNPMLPIPDGTHQKKIR
jgi:hypothetical protein